MKNSISIIFVFIFIGFGLVSCNKESQYTLKGDTIIVAKRDTGLLRIRLLNDAYSDLDSATATFTIVDANMNEQLHSVSLAMQADKDSFLLTLPQNLASGHYVVTNLVVTNTKNQICYSQQTNCPFTIQQKKTTIVSPVCSAYCLFLSVYRKNQLNNLNQKITAKVSLWVDDILTYSDSVPATTYAIPLPRMAQQIRIQVTKFGYLSFFDTFSTDKLPSFTKQNPYSISIIYWYLE